MDKLLQLIEKLRSELVPESPIASMSKPQLLQFIEESQFIERMRVFHQKGDRGIRSAITDDEDDNLIPRSGPKMACGEASEAFAYLPQGNPHSEEVYEVQCIPSAVAYKAKPLRGNVVSGRQPSRYPTFHPEERKKTQSLKFKENPEFKGCGIGSARFQARTIAYGGHYYKHGRCDGRG